MNEAEASHGRERAARRGARRPRGRSSSSKSSRPRRRRALRGHLDLTPLPAETRRARGRARPRAGARRRRADRRAAVRPRQCRRLCAARRRHRRRERGRAEAARAQRRGDRLRPRADARGAARHRDHHRHRRRDAARRRRRGDDRAHRADRAAIPAHRTAPRRRAGAVHLLCRLRHRARRDAAAQGRRSSARARSACWRPAGSPRSTWCGGRRSPCSRPATSWWRSGDTLRPGGVYDCNGAIIAAAVAEAGGEPVALGAFPDDDATLEAGGAPRARANATWWCCPAAPRRARAICRIASCRRLGKPGILVHGVALKPGKPLCLAVADGKPIAVLPGFPTSAIFTFHAFVAPVIRARAGLPPEAAQTVEARVPVRIASEMGRKEFVLVSLVAGEHGAVAFPIGKGLRRGDELLAGRRLHRDRRARRRARCRHARRASR